MKNNPEDMQKKVAQTTVTWAPDADPVHIDNISCGIIIIIETKGGMGQWELVLGMNFSSLLGKGNPNSVCVLVPNSLPGSPSLPLQCSYRR